MTEVNKAIEVDEIADEDLKRVFDAVSEKVSAGIISTKPTARLAGSHET